MVAARSFVVKAVLFYLFIYLNGSDLNMFKCQWESFNQDERLNKSK